ncbi:hypothetical protein GYMLUDRAFT_48036 [Collybiopsis luxurians FD-317 M1]|uniref:Uncharacterized protein n=1 Tax=Collybiopsis luxurians FD-317 M1 TaxID=944289 RepID=A0A0D0CJB9_9AGAR|nr:hypothetical protein GYMLUDRAFT_48036 [Collybiopsis luxurians FD-317 M1]
MSVFGWNLHMPYVASHDSPAPFVTLPCSPDNALIPRSSSNAHCPLFLLHPSNCPYPSSTQRGWIPLLCHTHTLSPFVTASKMGCILDVTQIHHL